MEIPVDGRAARVDRAGPIFLVGLIAAAFIPSLFISFDLSRLLAELERTAGRNPARQALFMAAEKGGISLDQDCDSCAAFMVSEGAETESVPASLAGSDSGIPFNLRGPLIPRWPPDTIPPQRAPPLS
jgi:hypothetical protein